MLRTILLAIRTILWRLLGTLTSSAWPAYPSLCERRAISNDKLTFTPSDIWAVLIAGAAAALCATIDLILKEEKPNENSET